MKKQLLAGAFVLASFFTAQAQEILSNNFGVDEESYAEQTEGWGNYAFDTDEDFITFFLDDPDAAELGFTGVSAFSASFINEGTEEEPILTEVDGFNFYASPVIDLTSVTNAYVSAKFGNIGAEASVMGFQVLVIAEEDWAAENFDGTLFIAGEGSVNAGESTDVSYDLTGFVGTEVRLLFLHEGEVTEGLGFLVFDDIVVTEGVMGTDSHLASTFSVYPNPATNVVNVVNAENILVNDITVTDLNGRTVKSAKFNGVADAQVNVSDLAAGVYMVTISSDKGATTKKIVKN